VERQSDVITKPGASAFAVHFGNNRAAERRRAAGIWCLEHVWRNQIQDSHGAFFVIPSA